MNLAKQNLLKLVFLLSLICPFLITQAQTPSGASGQRSNSMPPTGKIWGAVLDSANKQPVEFATVALFSARDSALIGGSVTDEKGFFDVSGLKPGSYQLRISFVGYKTLKKQLLLSSNDANNKASTMQQNLGNLWLVGSTQTLNTVTVTSEKGFMTQTIDKKVYNTDLIPGSGVGTANELLSNLPSVSVDNEGKLSLRGSENVTILIDGKPSGLSGNNLAQLPAATVKEVEIITNPSAKYDPDGTSGIINIVLKRSRMEGFSGTASLGLGTRARLLPGIQLNYQTKKWSFFGGMNAVFSRTPNWMNGERSLLKPDTTGILISNVNGSTLTKSGVFRLGVDFLPNSFNTFSVSGMFNLANKANESTTLYNWTTLENTIPLQNSIRESDEIEEKLIGDLNFSYRRNYNIPKKSFGVDVFFNRSREDKTVNYFDDFYVDGQTVPLLQRTQTDSLPVIANTLVANADLVHPFSKTTIFEAGARFQIRMSDNNSLNQIDTVNTSQSPDIAYLNHFLYRDYLYAAYATLASSIGGLNYKLGLRAEQVNILGELLTTNEKFENPYFSLFPTLNLTYAVAPGTLSFSYSRRINRPSIRNLNPYIEINDPYNQRRGNPQLKPEYINSFEVGYSQPIGPSTFSTTLFYRKTLNGFTRIVSVDTTNYIATITMQNLDHNLNYGAEFAWNGALAKWLIFNTSGSVFSSEINADAVDASLSNKILGWTAKLSLTGKLPKQTDIQVSGNYRSPRNTPQGRMSPFTTADISISKKLLQNKANLRLALNDVFNTMRFQMRGNADGSPFWIKHKRESRVLSLTFTYNFGKMQENNKQRRSSEQRSNEMRQDGGMDDF